MMMPPGEPVGPGVITTASMTPPTPPPPPVVSRVGEPQPGEIIIEVTRLLDMPVQESMFGGGLKQYRVRATDGDGVYLDQTDELSGIPENPNAPEDEETETLRLGLEGVLRFRTHDPVIFLTVEYAGGFTGNTRIGRCRIHRGDPRCKQVWPYALSTRDGDPVGCGIELKVVDGGPPAMSMPMMPPPPMGTTGMPPMGGPPPLATMPPMGGPPPPTATVGPSFHTMPPQELAAMMSQPGGPMSVEGPPGTMQTPSYRLTDPKDLERIQPPEGTMNPLNAPPNLQPPPTDQSFKTMSPEEMQRLAGYQTASPWDAAISQHRTSMSGKAQQEQQAGNIPVVAYIELERVVDLVAPMGSTPFPGAKSSTAGEQVVITLEPAREATVNDKRVQNLMDSIRENPAQTQQLMAQIRRIQGDLGVGKEVLDRSGPFESEMRGTLLSATCAPANLRVKVPFSDLAKGSTELRVVVWTQQAGGKLLPAGVTKNLTVSWKPEPPKYYPVFGAQDKDVGGIRLLHRFARESDVPPPIKQSNSVQKPAEASIKEGPGSTIFGGEQREENYPKGSKEDILTQSAVALEAQNRALLQRLKETVNEKNEEDVQFLASYCEKQRFEWTENGYRDWGGDQDPLDSLFITMGPNYVAKSEEVGCNICKVFEEDTSIDRELDEEFGPKALGKAQNPQDQATKMQLIGMMYKGDPKKIEASLRPVVSKPGKRMSRDGRQETPWPPDPPIYAPLSNLNPSDAETVRLANYDPVQSAKLPFADVNPNYCIQQDIWGALGDTKKSQAMLMSKPGSWHPKRVKDDCIMA